MDKPKGFKPKKDCLGDDGTPIRFTSNATYLVWKFLKKEKEVIWPKEIRFTRALLNFEPSMDFWEFAQLGFSLNSLAWFLSANGKLWLSKEKNRYEMSLRKATENKEIPLENSVIGENLTFSEKPKTLFDFIKK